MNPTRDITKRNQNKQHLEGLLRLAVEHTGPEDFEAKPKQCESDDERKAEFLQSALSTMSTPARDLEIALASLRNSRTVDEKLACLDVIRCHIDDIDLANSFVKIGGTQTLFEYIRNSDNNLRAESIYIVAEMAQNNVFCQNHFFNESIIPVIISTINDTDENLAKSSIYALSSIIQNFVPGLNEFIQNNGINNLLMCLKSSHNTVYIKSAFLIGSLASNENSVRELFNRQNAHLILLNNLEIKEEYDHKLDATLSALYALSLNSNWSLNQGQNLLVISKLQQITNNKILLETCQEMVNNAQNVLNSLITNTN